MNLFSFIRTKYYNNTFVISFTRISASVLGAMVLNFFWLVLFIMLGKSPGDVIRFILWCIAPVLIAGGYALGIIVYDRIIFRIRASFRLIFSWTLFGCALGEIVTLSSGPMVIGLSILSFGGIAVVLREINIVSRKRRGA